MPPFPRKDAEEQIVSLAKANDVSIRWIAGRDWYYESEAYARARLVRIPKPYNARQYLTALHEIGHVCTYHLVPTNATHTERQLMDEAAAWGWAMDHIDHLFERSLAEADYHAVIGKGFATHCWNASETGLLT